ncbi:MAG: hypothetical protein K2J11_09660 [Oscillospiraceae bacterium]|nr:hypothetical protein [Oscillospiraceae bacterium]
MKIKNAAALIAAAFVILLSGCTSTKPETVSETSATTVTTTENPYLLARGWDGQELLDSVFFSGENRTLPFKPEDNPDLTLSDSKLVASDGSYAEAVLKMEDEEFVVTALRFRRETAPADFSIYGTGFNLRPDDVPNIFGFANSIYGDEKTMMTYRFFDGGITELTFVFQEGMLSEVYIAA